VTGDFSVTNFGAASVAVGGSTTFDVTCDATQAGSPAAGTVSFNNDDPDENPFNFIVTCTVNPPPPFTVNSLADMDDGTCNVANCTLREAINAANSRVSGYDTGERHDHLVLGRNH
jgi:CSLREA domain-containing protein